MKTISIYIPAYNEEKSIGQLLNDLLVQKINKYKVEKICVISDCSTDSTSEIVKSFKTKKVKLIEREVRGGKSEVMNQAFNDCKSDVLVILDADIRLFDKDTISELVKEVLQGKVDLASADERVITPKTYLEKALYVSLKIKRDVFINYNKGDNFYTCHGQARAFSKKLYTKLRFPFSAGEDLYSYIYVKANNFKFKLITSALVYFKLPNNLHDHQKQSVRFSQANEKISTLFKDESINKYLRIPWGRVIWFSFINLIKNPFFVILNVFIFITSKIKSLFINGSQNTWSIAKSSK